MNQVIVTCIGWTGDNTGDPVGWVGQQLRESVHLLFLQQQVSCRLQAAVRCRRLPLFSTSLVGRSLDTPRGCGHHMYHGALSPRGRRHYGPRRGRVLLRVPVASRSCEADSPRQAADHLRHRNAQHSCVHRSDVRSNFVVTQYFTQAPFRGNVPLSKTSPSISRNKSLRLMREIIPFPKMGNFSRLSWP